MKTRLFALLPALLVGAAYADTCKTDDNNLAKRYKAMKYYGSYSRAADVNAMNPKARAEKFEQASQGFVEALKAHLSNPESWGCKLPVTDKEGLDISKSNDDKLRVFTWDKQTGNTKHEYSSLAQTRHAGSIVLTDLPDGWAQWTFNDNFRHLGALYGLSVNEVYDTSTYGETLRLYQISSKTGELAPIKMIQDRANDNVISDSLTYRYNRFKTDEALESTNRYIYDKDSNTFHFPVVDADRITARRTQYRYVHHTYLDKNKRRIHVHRFKFVR